MNATLKYKGYQAKIAFATEERDGVACPILHGAIEGLADLVTFESDDLGTIETAFHQAVDDYLAFCQEIGKSPEKAYRGLFNVRVSPSVHRILAKTALERDVSLNSLVEDALQEYIGHHELADAS